MNSSFQRFFAVIIAQFVMAIPVFSAPETLSEIPPPQPPFVKAPPPGSAWTMTAVYPAEVLASAPPEKSSDTPSTRTAHLEIRRGTNQVTIATLVDALGHKDAYYVVNEQILVKTRNTGSVFILAATQDSDIFDLRAPSFPVVNWLTTKNYVGVEKIGSILCYKFHQLPDPNHTDPIFNGERTAGIKVADGYPSKVQLDKMVFTFSEVTAYPYPIDLPVEYQAKLARNIARENVLRLLRKGSR